MKNITLTFLSFILVSNINGQELARIKKTEYQRTETNKSIDTKKTTKVHEKKMYVSGEKNVYIQKSQKVFLWVSSSNDPNAKKQLLTTESGSMEYFYFDTEGKNTIRSPWAVDPETGKVLSPKQDVVFDVYADGVAPETKSVFSGAPKYFNKGKVYYGKGLNIDLRSIDRVSKVENTYVALNKGEFKAYAQPIPVDQEDENSISYYAVDNVGNTEDPITKQFYVDTTNPETSYSVVGKSEGSVLAPSAKITLKSIDNLSQVKEIKYRIGKNGEYKSYNGAISLLNVPEGDLEINFYALDNVKNKEVYKSSDNLAGTNAKGDKINSKLFIDKTPPEVEIQVNGDLFKGKYTYISERSKMELVANDNKAGVKEILYGISEPVESNSFISPFTASAKKGVQYINYTAIDKVDNKTTNATKIIYLDNKAPETNISFHGVQVVERDSLFITSDTKIKLTTVEMESGVKNIQYDINKGSTVKYDEVFSLENEGLHNITYSATDNVNNEEAVKKYSVTVDNTPPVIMHTYSFPPMSRRPLEGHEYQVIPTYAKIYLAATDKTTGVKKITYKINGGESRQKSIIEYFRKGTFQVEITATDILGNEAIETIRFIVE